MLIWNIHRNIQIIENAFECLGIEEYYEKLVGFEADGASVNRGDKDCVKVLLKAKSPWLSFSWCIAQRLEQAGLSLFHQRHC